MKLHTQITRFTRRSRVYRSRRRSIENFKKIKKKKKEIKRGAKLVHFLCTVDFDKYVNVGCTFF